VTFTPEPCEWRLNWYIWCPVALPIAGAYNFTVAFQGRTIVSDLWSWPPPDGSPTTDRLTHVNPGPPVGALFTTNPPLATTVTAGVAQTASLFMWDALGNRALPLWPHISWDYQLFGNNGLPRPTGGVGFDGRTVGWRKDVLTNTVTRLNCTASCGASSNVTTSLDLSVAGKVNYRFAFTVAGTYSLAITHRGALPAAPPCSASARCMPCLWLGSTSAALRAELAPPRPASLASTPREAMHAATRRGVCFMLAHGSATLCPVPSDFS
jgi:hypothetical protein